MDTTFLLNIVKSVSLRVVYLGDMFVRDQRQDFQYIIPSDIDLFKKILDVF